MFRYLRRALLSLFIGTSLVHAAPTASPDSYSLTEDLPFTASGGPLFFEDFESGAAVVPFDGNWDYLDQLENENGASDGYPLDGDGDVWTDPDFDIGSSTIGTWESAAAPLQSGDIDAFPGAPDVLGGIDAAANGQNLVTTYLFRNTFTLDSAGAALVNWELEHVFDDSAVVYINGVEVFRTDNLPTGALTTTTLPNFVLGDESTYATSAVSLAGLIQAGVNTIAVELHQGTLNSSDVGMDVRIRPAASSSGVSLVYVDDPFPQPYDTDDPDFANGVIDPTGGFAGAGAYIQVGGAPGFFNPATPAGAWRLSATLPNPATVEISFRYRLVHDAGHEAGEDASVLMTVDGVLTTVGGNDYLHRELGDGNGGPDGDSGWVTFSRQLPLSAGLHTIDIGVHSSGSTTGSEVSDLWLDDIALDFVGGGAGGGVLDNDSGTAGMTAAVVTGPANGSLSLASDGTFSYVPDPDFNGTDTFTYAATDSTGTSAPVTVTLNVAPVNDAPVTVPRTVSLDEDDTLSVPVFFGLQLDASDVDGDTIQFSLAAGASNGTAAVMANGSWSYTPSADFNGTDSFTYTASDGILASIPETVTINVAPINDAPIAVADAYVTGENQALVVQQSGIPVPVAVLDEDFEPVAGPELSGFTNVESVAGFDGLGGFSGNFLRNRTSGDPADSSVITLSNLPPHDRLSIGFLLAVIDSWDGDANGGDRFTVRVDGVDVFSHTFENSGQGAQSYSPPAGVELARKVDLGFGGAADELDSAYDLSAEPSLQDIVHSASTVTIELFASGGDWSGGDDESWAVDEFQVSVLNTGIDELIPTGAVWKYLDDGSDQGTAWVNPGFNDNGWASGPAQLGYGDGDEATEVSFGPDDNNKFPTTYFRRTFTVVNPSAFGSLELLLQRDDGAAVYINGAEVVRDNLAPGAAFDDFAGGNAGNENAFSTFTVDPSVLVAGVNTIAVEVHQDDGNSSDISFDLRLRGLLPQVFGITNNDSDIDGPSLATTVVTNPANGSLSLNADGSFTYVPNANFEGLDTFVYSLSDGAQSDQATVTITITPGPNDVPVTLPESYSLFEDQTLSVSVASGVLNNDSDPEGQPLTAVLAQQASGGVVTLQANGSFTYQPNVDFNGSDSFAYRAFDGLDSSPPVTVSLSVIALNDAPVSGVDEYIAQPGGTLIITSPGVLVNDSDVDGDALTAVPFGSASAGSLVLNPSGSFQYTPPTGFAGDVTFAYRANDGATSSGVTTVTIHVNGAPTAVGNSYTVAEDSILSPPGVFALLANDSDPESDPLTAALVSSPANGSVSVAADGSFSYQPDGNFNGVDSFTYLVSDGLQNSSPATVTINITPVDDAPVAAEDDYFVLIDTATSIPVADGVLANDADEEGDTLSAQLVSDVSNGVLSLNSDGSFSYVPAAGFSGTDSFQYIASGGGQTSGVSTVEIFVGTGSGSVQITEIMFNPASEDPAEEYIEIHNFGAAPVPVSGWRFTSGIGFDFPDVVIPAGGYVVVAADPAAFTAVYGLGPSVIGPWTGTLSNSGERLRFVDGLGDEVDDITYSDQGDWARRRAEVDGGEDGWAWDNAADGGGASLQVVNLEISNKHGQNWVSSTALSPGAAGSVEVPDTAPLILDVAHAPAVPRPGQTVAVSAELKDVSGTAMQATLHWRESTANPGAFAAQPMFDDGLHGDCLSTDDIFGAFIPTQADGTVIEFYIESSDGNFSRTWPGPSDNSGAQEANALFQFDSEEYDGSQPIYRLVMPVDEDEEFLFSNHSSGSDAQKNTTLIARQGADTDIRYQCGVRIRGAGSRGRNPRNNRLNIPRDDPWNGVSKINLNTQFVYLQLLGSKLAHASNIEAADGKVVQVRHNGVNRADDNQINRRYGSYMALEPIDGAWADAHYPFDGDGNIYSKGRPDVKWDVNFTDAGNGDFSADADAYISDGWSKSSNSSENDWSDLHQLFITMEAATNPDYLSQVAAHIDHEQWARWFAYMTVVLSRETNLSNGTDDDYKMYRPLVDTRWKLVPHDFDTIFSLGDTGTDPTDSIFPPITNFGGQTFPQLVPFFEDPTICRLYYASMLELLDTVFEKDRFDATVLNDLDWFDAGTGVQQTIIDFMDARRAFIISQIPRDFSATSGLNTQNGYFRSTGGGAQISGTLDAARTASVLVEGQPAALDIRDGTWAATGTADPGLESGLNEILVQALDENGVLIGEETLTIWLDDGNGFAVSGSIVGNTTWTADGGPYEVMGDILVPAGSTLTIEAGSSVFFLPGMRLTVEGQLIAVGSPLQRITFASEPGSGGWDGVYFDQTTEDNQLAFVDMIGSDAGSQSIEVIESRLLIDSVTWTETTDTILELDNPQLEVRNSTFPGTDGAEVIHGVGLVGADYFILRDNEFQTATGYNDVIDFSGGRRPGPIIQVLGNVFNGASDDVLDLDGTDAHIEGNIFRNIHTDDPSRESTSNAIATDDFAHLTVVRNLFIDVDHALLLKNNADAVFENNTVIDATIAAIGFDEPARAGFVPGDELVLRNNVFHNVNEMFAHQFATVGGEDDPVIVATNNIMPAVHHGLGTGNLDADPLFADAVDFALSAGSPARSAGTNGADLGYRIAAGATISGEPPVLTRATGASLQIEMPGVAAVESPGAFVTEYQWRLDGGPWNGPVNVAFPITLSGLSDGAHSLEVIGKDSAGVWQIQPTLSKTWVVDSSLSRLLITEVLADNGGAYDHEGSFPDVIELWNDSAATVNISGYGLSDDVDDPARYTFPAGTTIAAGSYLQVFANDPDGTSGLHAGFGLSAAGDAVVLSDAAGLPLDSVEFGFQLPARSISRVGQAQQWALTSPTPGVVNGVALPVGTPDAVVINEWFATAGIVYADDFLELYNAATVPVSLSGATLTDDPNNRPTEHVIAPLSFIEAGGFVTFDADGNESAGPDHLSFSLSKLIDHIALFSATGEELDRVQFNNAIDETSEGRAVDGAEAFASFAIPTPSQSNGTNLSAQTALLQSLRITELMYNPVGGSDVEYVKIENIGSAPVNLGDVRLSEGVNFFFPITTLPAGGMIYVSPDPAAFTAEYGALPVVGPYTGKLDNGGERVRLEITSIGAGILDFSYDDEWYPITDGGGAALQIVDAGDEVGTWDFKESWQATSIGSGLGYDDWVLATFGAPAIGSTGKNDDPDQDGISNLLEFVFMLDPQVPDPDSARPQLSIENGLLTLTYTTAQLPAEVTIHPEVSSDLRTWTDAGADVSVQLESVNAGAFNYTATLNEALGFPAASQERFMRLRVECQ